MVSLFYWPFAPELISTPCDKQIQRQYCDPFYADDYGDMTTPVIPGYRIIKLLGEGGMAKVYLAVQTNFDRHVALKIIAPHLAKSDPQYGERFIREARIVAQLSHPHIVTVYDVGEHQGLHYLSMEYIAGSDLRLRRESLSLKQNLDIIKQIALALDFAHQKGYIHRDIKPENILIHGQDQRAVLTDFGIARIAGNQDNLTQTGTAIGTPSFMSPEQALGKSIDHRSDIYSLGVVLFYVLTGRVPFTAESAVAIGLQHAVEPVPRLEGAFIQFQPVLEKVMAKQPERRYQSGQEFAEVLTTLVGKLSPETEQLWRESFATRPATPAAGIANDPTVVATLPAPASASPVAKVVSIDKSGDKPPRQPTPLVARRETTFVPVMESSAAKRRVMPLLLLLTVSVLVALVLQPEWADPLRQAISTLRTTGSTAARSPSPTVTEALPISADNDLDDAATTTASATELPAPATPPSALTTATAPLAEFDELTELSRAKNFLDIGNLIEPDNHNAEAAYRRIVQENPRSSAAKDGLVNVGIALAARGLRLAESGDLSGAQRDYERALLLAPRDRDVQLLRQRLALLSHDKEANDWVIKANAALKNNRWLLPDGDNAQEYFQRALSIQPGNKEALRGSKELEQTIANRVKQLWQRKQYVDASDLLALAQKKYVVSETLDAVAAQTVGASNARPASTSDAVATINALPAPMATVAIPVINGLSVNLQTDPASNAKFLRATFDFRGASAGSLLIAKVTVSDGNKTMVDLPVTLTTEAGKQEFDVATLDEHFADGKYRLTLYLRDKKLAEVNFTVGR